LSFILSSSSIITLNAKDGLQQLRTFCGFCRDVTGTGSFCFKGDPDDGCPTSTWCDPPTDLPYCGLAVPCVNDAECADDGDEYESCTQRSSGAFAEAAATRISLTGNTDGQCLGDDDPHPVNLVGTLCVIPTFTAMVDQAGDLPGPAAVVLSGSAQLLPTISAAQVVVVE
jgi:hypothetical protein